MMRFRNTLSELRHYPSAVAGLAVIVLLILIALYTVITIPYGEAIRLWRGGEDIWYRNPKNVPPAWSNWFRGEDKPETILQSSLENPELKTREVLSETTTKIVIPFTFEFPYDDFPQEVVVRLAGEYEEKLPFITLTWLTPDGREIEMATFTLNRDTDYRASQDANLTKKLGGVEARQGLFADITAEVPYLVRGTYQLRVDAVVFEPDADVDAEMIIYGKVHGLAGTDHRRRDLSIALLWGTPIALTFGLLAAVGTTVTTMIIAAIGVWFSGWVDGLIQRITEVNLILPVLPILIMVGTFYSRSIWVILGVIILLSIFGGSIKGYRAIFMQVRQASYIEAAQAYGAGHARIIFRYMVPRIIPILIPSLVTLIPGFVFLEASLAVLGLGDPVLPTWGKVIDDARAHGALLKGWYYWILEPSFLLMMTGLAFAMLGFSLDRIFNPRLREI
jgi:peptide/nickel transport system permease protein